MGCLALGRWRSRVAGDACYRDAGLLALGRWRSVTGSDIWDASDESDGMGSMAALRPRFSRVSSMIVVFVCLSANRIQCWSSNP